jgi:hypothetical protein
VWEFIRFLTKPDDDEAHIHLFENRKHQSS